jgi:hypothetical protein
MKSKFLIISFVLFITVISVSGCLDSKKHFEDEDISFDHPSKWETGRIMDLPGAIITVGNDNTDVIIYKNKINNSFSLKEKYSSVKENNKKKLAKYCYKVISESTMKVDGTEAYEIIYKIGCNDTQTRQLHRNIILEKKGYIYSISCTVIPPEEFDNQKSNLDIIIESFHVK